MIERVVAAIVHFPFELLEAFLTPFLFPSRTPSSAWERAQTARERTLRETVKRLRHQLRTRESAHQRAAEYWQRLFREHDEQHRKELQEQDERHRTEVQELEKRYRDRER